MDVSTELIEVLMRWSNINIIMLEKLENLIDGKMKAFCIILAAIHYKSIFKIEKKSIYRLEIS